MKRDQISMLVANNIKSLMEARGMTAASLGRTAGLNATGIYDILSGKSQSPRIVTLGKIADGLNVPLSAIFEEDDTQTIESDVSSMTRKIKAYAAKLSPERRDLLLRTAQAWSEESS